MNELTVDIERSNHYSVEVLLHTYSAQCQTYESNLYFIISKWNFRRELSEPIAVYFYDVWIKRTHGASSPLRVFVENLIKMDSSWSHEYFILFLCFSISISTRTLHINWNEKNAHLLYGATICARRRSHGECFVLHMVHKYECQHENITKNCALFPIYLIDHIGPTRIVSKTKQKGLDFSKGNFGGGGGEEKSYLYMYYLSLSSLKITVQVALELRISLIWVIKSHIYLLCNRQQQGSKEMCRPSVLTKVFFLLCMELAIFWGT
jgi:hypothetical protein